MGNNLNKKIICIYHKGCIDGTTAAAVFLKKFPDIQFFPLKHNYANEEIDTLCSRIDNTTTVYIVDFSLQKDSAEKLLKHVNKIINIDHHIGVSERLESLAKQNDKFEYIFDNERSGASLSWIYFYKDEEIPKLIKYVEDNDLFKGQMGNETFYVTNYLAQFVNKPEKIKAFIESKEALENILKQGKIIAEYNDFQVQSVIENTKEIHIRIGEHTVLAYNTPEFLRSHIGKILSREKKQTVALFAISGNNVRVHFRGQEENNPSALLLAQTLGGNGHRNAAAASVPLKEFYEIIVSS